MLSLSSTSDSKLGTHRKVAIYPVTSTSPGTETCPRTLYRGSGSMWCCLPCSRMGQEPGDPSSSSLLCGKGFLLRESFIRRGESLPVTRKSSCARCYSQVTSGGNQRSNKHRVETWSILRAAEKVTPPPPPPFPERASPGAAL